MSKRCPQCQQLYAENARFCDVDGTPLVALETRVLPAARRPWLWLGLGLALLLGAPFAAHQLYQRHLRAHFTVTLENVFLATESAGLLGRALTLAQAVAGDANLVARVKLDNSTLFSGAIISARYALSLGERQLGQGTWMAPQPAPFQPGQSLGLDLPFRLDSRQTVGGLLDRVSGQLTGQLTGPSGPLRMQGELVVRVWGFDFPVPFDVTFQGMRLEQPALPIQ
jgi:hypothetical protein